MDFSGSKHCEEVDDNAEGEVPSVRSSRGNNKRVATPPIVQSKLRKLTTCPSDNSESCEDGMDMSAINERDNLGAVKAENSIRLEIDRGTDHVLHSNNPSTSGGQSDCFQNSNSHIPGDSSLSEGREDGFDVSAISEKDGCDPVKSENGVNLQVDLGTDITPNSSATSTSGGQGDNFKCNNSGIPGDTTLRELRKYGMVVSALNERDSLKAVTSEISVGLEIDRGTDNADKVDQSDHVDNNLSDVCKIPISKSHLMSNKHTNAELDSYSQNVSILGSAFKKRIITFRVKPPQESDSESIDVFFKSIESTFLQLLTDMVQTHKAIKVHFILSATFVLQTKEAISNFHFPLTNSAISGGENLKIFFESICTKFAVKIEDFKRKDSGWSFKNTLHLDINVNKYKPLSGSFYIKLPNDIQAKKAVINVKNQDNKCFTWALLSALYPVDKNTDRPRKYEGNFNKINMEGIDYPVSLKDVGKVEKLNNISINIFTLECNRKKNEVVGPIYHTKDRKTNHVNLLYISEGDKGHYCYIKDLSKLVSHQLNKTEHKRYFCDGCLINFTTKEKLHSHMKFDCKHLRVLMPNTNLKQDRLGREVRSNILKFENCNKQLKVPFVIYADFEAFLTPLNNNETQPEVADYKYVQKHEVYSFAYYVKCSYDDGLSRYKTYRGSDCVKVFFKTLSSDVNEICDALKLKVPMIDLSPDEKNSFLNAVDCYLCNAPLNRDSVRDHDHLTGKFRGAAHTNCNLNYKLPQHIPIFLHNLSNYDAHFIVRELNSVDGDIELIPLNMEKYISFTKNLKVNDQNVKLRFLDSFRFMNSSLQDLAKNLETEKFIELRRLFPDDNDFSLLIRKGIYPYDLIKSYEDLNNLTALPAQKDFHNHLHDTAVSNEDYNHALKVWTNFKCKDMGEYSDLYLKTDVLILTDVFENFRSLCIKTYNLDPVHYYTLPGLSWDAMLKLTKIELELLTDFEMLAFIKKGIRGGMSQCSNRHAKANNKYLPNFDPKIEESYITYLDANNLYGWAMSKPLPYGDFKWVPESNIPDFRKVSDTSDVGYIVEVDLKYPIELHDNHSDLPFCPELTETPTCKEKRLINNLYSKERYIIHYTNLVQCMNNGLELTKVHRILQFKQKPWLKTYIDLNTSLRANSISSFDVDFYKLMNNSVFGKTMENIEKYNNIKIVTHWENIGKKQGAIGLIKKPEFHSSNVISENLVAIQLNKTKLLYNKPIYLGLCVLDLSKTLMYNFHYGYMKKKYGKKIKLMYMDTDSFVYHVFTHDFYTDILDDLPEYFDSSGYETDNQFGYTSMNKKEIGFFKDEFKGSIVKEFVGLRSKLYAIEIHNTKKLITKAKGVNKCVTAKLKMSEYEDCLFNQKKISKEMYRFKSENHIIYTQKLKKNALSSNDSKRFLIPNSTDTLAWGHCRINSYQT